jgi:hypothetical protein
MQTHESNSAARPAMADNFASQQEVEEGRVIVPMAVA